LTFGIIRSDATDKPVAHTLQRFAQEARQTVPLPAPIVREDEWYANMTREYQQARYAEYVAMHTHAHA
jgi:hypothetical protein